MTQTLTPHRSWNDKQRHDERRRQFNVAELTRLAAAAVDRSAGDVLRLEKLAEGGFNRSFLLTMRGGFQMVARIPYSVTEPKHLLVASEVATIDFLRSRDFPVPKIHGYSNSAENLLTPNTFSWSSRAERILAIFGTNSGSRRGSQSSPVSSKWRLDYSH